MSPFLLPHSRGGSAWIAAGQRHWPYLVFLARFLFVACLVVSWCLPVPAQSRPRCRTEELEASLQHLGVPGELERRRLRFINDGNVPRQQRLLFFKNLLGKGLITPKMAEAAINIPLNPYSDKGAASFGGKTCFDLEYLELRPFPLVCFPNAGRAVHCHTRLAKPSLASSVTSFAHTYTPIPFARLSLSCNCHMLATYGPFSQWVLYASCMVFANADHTTACLCL